MSKRGALRYAVIGAVLALVLLSISVVSEVILDSNESVNESAIGAVVLDANVTVNDSVTSSDVALDGAAAAEEPAPPATEAVPDVSADEAVSMPPEPAVQAVPEPQPRGNLLRAPSSRGDVRVDPAVFTHLESEQFATIIVNLEEAQAIGKGVSARANQQVGISANEVSADRGAILEQRRATATAAKARFFENMPDARGVSSANQGKRVLNELYSVGILVMQVDSAGLDDLLRNPEVKHVALDGFVTIDDRGTTLSSDEKGVSLNESAPLINSDNVWNLSVAGVNLTGHGRIICVIDTGIDHSHLLFGPFVEASGIVGGVFGGYDFVNNDTNSSDDHVPGHGTHVSGIVVGNFTGTPRLQAPAHNARVVPVKVCSSSGSCPNSSILAGVDYCNNNISGVDVISGSLGGGAPYNSTTCSSDSLYTELEALLTTSLSLGIIPVFASGNNGCGAGCTTGVDYPGCSPQVISVGSTDKSDAISSFTDHGGDRFDIYAPGQSIRSSIPTFSATTLMSGTSQATPHVSSAIAIIQQNELLNGRPKLNLTQIRQLLQQTGVPIGTNDSRVDIYAMIMKRNLDYSINRTSNTIKNDTINTTIVFGSTVNFSTAIGCIDLRPNFAGVNSTNCPQFDTSAHVILGGVTSPAVPTVDGVTCDSATCQNVTLTSRGLEMDVLGFSNISSISGCPTTITTSTDLSQNIASDGTCITFGADNIELDCLGFNITYSNNTLGYGINATDRTNITIKNCNVQKINMSMSDAHAILLSGTNRSFIINSTANATGPTSSGIRLFLTNNNTVVNSTGESNVSFGIELSVSEDTYLLNNTGVSNTSDGIRVSSTGLNNLTANRGTSNTSDGISVTSNLNNLVNNTGRSVDSGSIGRGTLINGNTNVVTGHTSSGTSGSGLSLGGSHNTFSNMTVTSQTNNAFALGSSINNTITLTTFSSAGGNQINFGGASDNNTFAHSAAIGTATALRISTGDDNNTFYNMTMNGSGALTIDIQGSLNTTITNSVISGRVLFTTAHGNLINASTITGGCTACIELVTGSENNTIRNTTIRSTGGAEAVEISASSHNLFVNVTASAVSNGASFDFLSGAHNNTVNQSVLISEGVIGSDGVAVRFSGGDENVIDSSSVQTNVYWIRASATSTGNNFSNLSFNSPANGSIRYANFTMPTDTIFGVANLSITLNRSFVNSTLLPILNTSAEVVLRSLPFSSAQLVADFEDDGTFAVCSAPTCNVTSYTGGVLTFNVSRFTAYAASESPELTACTNLSGSQMAYTLINNISSGGTCMNITGSNISLDCRGFTINYSQSVAGNAINITGNNNTITNCVIFEGSSVTNAAGIQIRANGTLVMNTSLNSSASTGVLMVGGFNNSLTNNTVRNSGSLALGFNSNGGSNNTFTNNTVFANLGGGFNIGESGDTLTLNNATTTSTISDGILVSGTNNTLLSNNGSSNMGAGIRISGGSNNLLINNTAFNTVNSAAIALSGTTRNQLINNTGIGTSSAGIGFTFVSTFNVLTGNRGMSTFGNGITLSGASDNNQLSNGTISVGGLGVLIQASNNNNLTNNTIVSSSLGSPAISLTAGATGQLFLNNTVSSNSVAVSIASGTIGNQFNGTVLVTNQTYITTSSGSNNFSGTTFNTSVGSIYLPGQFIAPSGAIVNVTNVNISQNRTFVNSTNVSFLNMTAQLVLGNLSFTYAGPFVDFNDTGSFVRCRSPECTSIVYSGGVLSFTAASFTAYSASTVPFPITSCPVDINSSAEITQNLTSAGTCINIANNSVDLNCQGFTINHSNSELGAGINATGRTNVTIRDCIVVQGNESTGAANGILISGTTNSTVTNVTVNATGDGSAAINVRLGSSFNTISYANTLALAAGTGTGISLNGANNNTIAHSSAFANGTSGSGLVLTVASDNNTVLNNSLTSILNAALAVSSSSGNTIENNTAFSNESIGISLTSASNGNVLRGNIGGGNLSQGARIHSSDRNVVVNNTFYKLVSNAVPALAIQFISNTNVLTSNRAIGTAGPGILLEGDSGNTTLQNNNASSVSGAAIRLISTQLNNLTNNTGTSTSGYGIEVNTASNNSLVNNTGVSDSSDGIAILLIASGNNTLSNTTGISNSGSGITIGSSWNNTLYRSTGVSTSGAGIVVATANDNVFIESSGISGSGQGMFFNVAARTNITRSNATSTSFYGLEFNGGSANRVEQSRGTSQGDGGLYLTGGTALNFFDNSTFESNTAGAVEFGSSSGQNNNFTNTTLHTNVTWIKIEELSTTGNNFTNTLFENSTGSIRIVGNFTLPSTTNLTYENVNVSFNKTFINSTNVSFLNQSAIITLRNLPFGSARPVFDENDTGNFSDCESSRCTIISYSGGTFVFNVSSFSAYASVDAGGVSVTKTDSQDPVVRGALYNYTILINNTNNFTVFNVTAIETYPAGVVFVSSQPTASPNNATFALGTLAANTSTTINITLRAGSGLANGTVLNNTVSVSFAPSNGTNTSVNVSEFTTIQGIPVISTTKTDSPDPVPRGTTLAYVINVTNTGDEIAYNITVIESYPVGVTFNGSEPLPSSGDNIFSIGNLSPSASFLMNITVNVSGALANGSVLNNSYTVTFANLSGVNLTIQNSTLTSVRGSPNISVNKTDSVDPVFAGDQFVYRITLNNTGDDTAFNISVIEGYPAGVSFVTAQPTPAGNDTFAITSLAPGTQFVINITLTSSAGNINGTILNNSVNVTFANSSGQNATTNTSELTTVIQPPVISINKTGNQTTVVKGQSINYTITINNTGESVAFNVTVVETYPAGTVFVGAQPNATSGNGTFNVGDLQPNQSTTINITLNVSGALTNGTIINNTVNATANRTDGQNVTRGNSTTTTVLGFPQVSISKSDAPDPVVNGTTLTYVITITNSGDEIAYNVTVTEGYPANVTLLTTQPTPTPDNATFPVGNLLPGQTFLINITVNVSGNMTSGQLNNSANVTFANVSGVNLTLQASALTTAIPPPVPFVPGGGGGGGGGGAAGVSTTQSMSGNTMTTNYLRAGDKVNFQVNALDHTMTVLTVLNDQVRIRVASIPQEFTLKRGAVQPVDVTGDGQTDVRISVTDIAYSKALFYLEKAAFSPAVVREPAPVPAPLPTPEPAKAPEPVPVQPVSAPVREPLAEVVPQGESEGVGSWIMLAGALLVVAGLAGGAFYFRKSQGAEAVPQSSMQRVEIAPRRAAEQVHQTSTQKPAASSSLVSSISESLSSLSSSVSSKMSSLSSRLRSRDNGDVLKEAQKIDEALREMKKGVRESEQLLKKAEKLGRKGKR